MRVFKRLCTVLLFVVSTFIALTSAGAVALQDASSPPVCGTANSFPEYPPTSLESAVEMDLADSDCVAAGDSYLANFPPSSVMPAHADVASDSSLALLASSASMCSDTDSSVEGSIVDMNGFMQGAVLVNAAETGGSGQDQPGGDCVGADQSSASLASADCRSYGGASGLQFMQNGDCAFASDSQPAGASQVNLVSNTCTSGGEAAGNPGVEGSIVNMNSFMQGAALVNASETGGDGRSC